MITCSAPSGRVSEAAGKDAAKLAAKDFDTTAGLVAAQQKQKGQCCASHASPMGCRAGVACPHLHPKPDVVLKHKWKTASSAATSPIGAGKTVEAFSGAMVPSNPSFTIPIKALLPTANIDTVKRTERGSLCVNHLRQSCSSGAKCQFLHPSEAILASTLRDLVPAARLRQIEPPPPPAPAAAATPSGPPPPPSSGAVVGMPTPAAVAAAVPSTQFVAPVDGDDRTPMIELMLYERPDGPGISTPIKSLLRTAELDIARKLRRGIACSHHLRETCTDGSKCRFLHPNDDALVTTLRAAVSHGKLKRLEEERLAARGQALLSRALPPAASEAATTNDDENDASTVSADSPAHPGPHQQQQPQPSVLDSAVSASSTSYADASQPTSAHPVVFATGGDSSCSLPASGQDSTTEPPLAGGADYDNTASSSRAFAVASAISSRSGSPPPPPPPLNAHDLRERSNTSVTQPPASPPEVPELHAHAGLVLAAAALDLATFAVVPHESLPAAPQVAAAMSGLLGATHAHPPYTAAHRTAVALFTNAFEKLAELLTTECHPHAAPPSTASELRWASYTRGILHRVAPVMLSTDALHVLMNAMASQTKRRSSCGYTLHCAACIIEYVTHERAPAELRRSVLEGLDAVTKLELCQHGRGLDELREKSAEALRWDSGPLDRACAAWATAALRVLSDHGADAQADPVIGVLLRAVSRRVDTIWEALEACGLSNSELAPFDALLVQIEQVTCRVCLQRWEVRCALTIGTAEAAQAPPDGHTIFAVVPPGPSDRSPSGLWLCVAIDPSLCVSFQQWSPALFIGQYVQLTAVAGRGAPSASQPSTDYRCLIVSIEAHKMYVKQDDRYGTPPRPPWQPASTVVNVRVEHNAWHLDSLLGVRRHRRAAEFERALAAGALATQLRAVPSQAGFVPTPMPLDPCQTEFVRHVMWAPRLVVLRGPPGTGKTYSATAAIDVIARNGAGRVLACATSNYAANHLAMSLRAQGVRVGRVFSASTAPFDVRNSNFRDVLGFCNPVRCPRRDRLLGHDEKIERDAVFQPADGPWMQQFDVVCATTAHVGWMARVPGLDFSYVFVDECAQGTAAETLLPVTVVGEAATVVLIGDAQQLGPAVISDVAQHHGLGRPFFEAYAPQLEAPPVLSTTLKRCYRCHPAILGIFNRLFYGGFLEPGRRADSFAPVRCAFRPPRAPPDARVLFVDVKPPAAAASADDRDDGAAAVGVSAVGANATYDNPDEADAVVAAVVSLLRDNRRDDGGSFAGSIGVIAGFRHQVLTINARLRAAPGISAAERAAILVGTVDQYQGQERPVVLLSMVRATRDTLLAGSSAPAGLVGDARKTNVALSRAASLLVVFGSRDGLLRQPPSEPWRAIVESLHKGGGIVQPSAVRQQKLAAAPAAGGAQVAAAAAAAAADFGDDDW